MTRAINNSTTRLRCAGNKYQPNAAASHATPSIVKAAVDRFGGGTPAVWRPVAAFLRSYQLDGGYTSGPVLVLCTLTGLVGSVFVLRRRAPGPQRQLALACLLFFACAVSVTLMSDLFVFSWRYQLPALVTLVPAGALGIHVIFGRLRTQPSPDLRPPRAEDG